jgi:hypothetical protein
MEPLFNTQLEISHHGGLHLTGPMEYTAEMAYPCAGKDYPRSLGEFQAWFRTDADCLDYPDGAPDGAAHAAAGMHSSAEPRSAAGGTPLAG